MSRPTSQTYRHDSARIPRRGGGGFSRRAKAFLLAVGLLTAGIGLGAPSAYAVPTDMVDLGLASTYAVLSGASVGNTVNAAGAPHTTVRGDLGVKANAQPTGFPPGVVTGAIASARPPSPPPTTPLSRRTQRSPVERVAPHARVLWPARP